MLPFSRRLLSVLLATAAAGCNESVSTQACYVAGGPYGQVQTQMPDLPCLPRKDPTLSILNPGCTEDFEITSGPEQKTNASNQATCCYDISYDKVSGCQVGRPLWSGDEQRFAPLAARGDWGA